jgi:hypothetical protein
MIHHETMVITTEGRKKFIRAFEAILIAAHVRRNEEGKRGKMLLIVMDGHKVKVRDLISNEVYEPTN